MGNSEVLMVWTKEELIQWLYAQQGDRTQKEFASVMGCTSAYLSDVYAGKRDPGPKILKAMGLVKQVTYKKWRKEDDKEEE